MSIMRGAGQWARDRQWTERDLEEAKISVFQRIDAPRSVNQEGMGEFLYGITEEMRQARRELLLDVSRDDIREVAQKYLVDALEQDKGRVCFLGRKQEWVNGEWTIHDMDANGRN